VSRDNIRPWVVEVRCSDLSQRPQVIALWRDLDHLPGEVFDTSQAVGLRVEVLATDEAQALGYVQARITVLHGRKWLKGVDYDLSATPRRR
jgi:hypothetical protein